MTCESDDDMGEGHFAAPSQGGQTPQSPSQRLANTFRFKDPDMDLFFVSAVGWGPAGGLDIGQVFYVASKIIDGDADSWVSAFSAYGDAQSLQADVWNNRGWIRAAGEMRLKAFASYRSSWQFAPVGEVFASLYRKHKAAFSSAMRELSLPAEFFDIPYKDKALPGVYFRNASPNAPVILVIGGADTCFEDLFLSIGRNLLDRGFSVAIMDLPGQGAVQADGLYWEVEIEKPIAAVLDTLVGRFGAEPGRMALIGLSLGGYFATRAAGHEPRFGAVIASTPLSNPGEMFALAMRANQAAEASVAPSSATLRGRKIFMWKAGVETAQELVEHTAAMVADPELVTVPFLSVLGGGESAVFADQAKVWHNSIRSERKAFVRLDASTGADGHCQVNNRLRLAQEACGWLDEIFTS